MFARFGITPPPQPEHTIESGPTPHELRERISDPYRKCSDDTYDMCRHDLGRGVLVSDVLSGVDGSWLVGPSLTVVGETD